MALSGVADWDYLLQVALKHGVFPSLYRRLADSCSEAVPRDVLDAWGRLYRVHARRNLRLTVDLLQVLSLFESQGISAISLKGPVLAQTAYNDLTLRQFVDLDILVSRTDVEKVRDLLVAGGYRLSQNLTRKQERFHLKHSDGFAFENARQTRLDVHWRFLPASIFGGGLDPEEALARRVPVQILGKTVYFLHPEDNLLMLCQHGSTNHFWHTLSMVSDVAQLMHSRKTWNWPRVFQRAKDSGLHCQALLGLSLARGNF